MSSISFSRGDFSREKFSEGGGSTEQNPERDFSARVNLY